MSEATSIPPLPVAVTGATGFVGRSVVRALLDRGHRVRALARTPEKAAEVLPVRADGMEVIIGDARAPGALEQLATGAGAYINLLGIIRERRGQRFSQIHVEATRNGLAAAQKAGAKRFVQMSALGVSDEARTGYMKTKWEAERLVVASGMDWTIFRPSMIHGPAGEFTQMMASWARGAIAPWKFMPYFARAETDISVPAGPTRYVDPIAAPIYVDDVAVYFADSLTSDQTIGEVYNLVGPERLRWPTLLRTVRDATPGGFERINPVRIPADVAAMGAMAAEKLGLGAALPFDAGMAVMGAQDTVADLAKARADFDIEPRAFTAVLPRYARKL